MKRRSVKLLVLAMVVLLLLPLVACQNGSTPSTQSPPSQSPSQAPSQSPSQSPSQTPSQSPSQSPSGQEPAGPAKPDSIKIGFIDDLTGSSAAQGIYMQQGWEMAMKQLGNKLGGVDVQTVLEDSASDPSTAVTKATKLIDNDNVDILFGSSITACGNAIAPVAVEKQVPFVMPVVAADTLTQHSFSPYIFRTGWNSSQPMYLFGKYAHDVMGLNTIAVVASDFAFLYEQVGAFKIGFELAGGKITDVQWVPLNQTDFGAYTAAIPTNVDALLNCITGGSGPTFVQEVANYGIKDKMTILSSGTTVEESWLEACGDAAVGYISASHYSNAIGTPAMNAFTDEFESEYKVAPAFAAESCYSTALMLDAVYQYIFDNGLDYKNIDDLNTAFHAVKVEIPRGTLQLDEMNSAINNIYIRRVDKIDNNPYAHYQNTPIMEWDNVDQWGNGPFTKEQRLALPIYSRDWPWNASGIY